MCTFDRIAIGGFDDRRLGTVTSQQIRSEPERRRSDLGKFFGVSESLTDQSETVFDSVLMCEKFRFVELDRHKLRCQAYFLVEGDRVVQVACPLLPLAL